MKISAIIISLAFLGASHSVQGAFPDPGQIGDVFENGLCKIVRGLNFCPPNPLPCTYETVQSRNQWFGMYISFAADCARCLCLNTLCR